INIESDGRLQLVKPPFTVTDLPDGNAKVEIHARTLEDLKKMLPHLAARLRMTEEQVIQQITQNGQAALVEMRLGRIHHHIARTKALALLNGAPLIASLPVTVASSTRQDLVTDRSASSAPSGRARLIRLAKASRRRRFLLGCWHAGHWRGTLPVVGCV